MKKLLSLMILLAGVTVFTSCSDDDATYTPAPVLEVSNADLKFEATGGTGQITVNTAGTLTAKSESQWITLQVSGNTVTVTVAENTTLNGRSANIVLSDGQATSEVTATQKGGTYGLEGGTSYSVNDKKNTIRIGLTHTSAVTVESQVDWIDASFDDETDEFVITVAANETGWRRSGVVKFQTGDIEDQFTINQFDFDTDVLGEYDFIYMNSADQKWYYYPAELTAKGLVLTMSSTRTMTVPVEYDKNALEIAAGPSGSYLGTYNVTTGPRYTYLMYMATDGSHWTGYTTSASLTTYTYATLEEVEYSDGSKGVEAEFEGTFGSYEIGCWNFQNMNKQEFASANSTGYMLRAWYPYLAKDIAATSAAAPGKAPSRAPKGKRQIQLGPDPDLEYILAPAE